MFGQFDTFQMERYASPLGAFGNRRFRFTEYDYDPVD